MPAALRCPAAALILSTASCAPLDLHSFPTRRSSDLIFGSNPRSPPPPSSSRIRSHGTQIGLWNGKIQETRSVRPRPLADRKSTRLNSSHLGISYAVFCLKKKNTKRHEKGDAER